MPSVFIPASKAASARLRRLLRSPGQHGVPCTIGSKPGVGHWRRSDAALHRRHSQYAGGAVSRRLPGAVLSRVFRLPKNPLRIAGPFTTPETRVRDWGLMWIGKLVEQHRIAFSSRRLCASLRGSGVFGGGHRTSHRGFFFPPKTSRPPSLATRFYYRPVLYTDLTGTKTSLSRGNSPRNRLLPSFSRH